MTLRITQYGEAVLHQQGETITQFDEALIDLADDMVDTMYEADGIGLAAQQIDRAIMLCVVDVAPEGMEPGYWWELDGKQPPIDLIMPMALVNPVVKKTTKEKDVVEEGCLSFPEIRGNVKRPVAIEVEYQDLEGAPHTLKCDGIFARCIQHEVDHLNGVLFNERMDSKTVRGLKSQLRELKSKTLKQIESSKS